MMFAFRRDAATGATLLQRVFCWLIKVRLVSQYCHGGVVIDGTLYHITASHGHQVLGPGQWTPAHWDLFEVGGDDAVAIARFEALRQPPAKAWQRWVWRLCKGYDWVSLLAFVGPLVRVSWLNYCFELMHVMRTGMSPTTRITPESLLSHREPRPGEAFRPEA